MLVAFAALCSSPGCRVDALEGAEYVGPKNRCNLGCPSGSTCVGEMCVAEQASYPLIVEATPPPAATYAPGVTFSFEIDSSLGGATRASPRQPSSPLVSMPKLRCPSSCDCGAW